MLISSCDFDSIVENATEESNILLKPILRDGTARYVHTFKWKQITNGSLFTVNCLVDSCCILHLLHSIFTVDPKCSARVNCSRQSTNDSIWTGESKLIACMPGSEFIFNEISVNCSTFVETLLQTVDCKYRQSYATLFSYMRRDSNLPTRLANHIRLQKARKYFMDNARTFTAGLSTGRISFGGESAMFMKDV